MNTLNERSGRTIFEAQTPRQLLDMFGETPDSQEAREEYGWIFDLAEKHGWDTTIYRADYLLGEGAYQAVPVTAFDACVAAVTHDLHSGRVFKTDEEAIAALDDDPIFSGHQGARAQEALRAQLVRYDCISAEEEANDEGGGPRP